MASEDLTHADMTAAIKRALEARQQAAETAAKARQARRRSSQTRRRMREDMARSSLVPDAHQAARKPP
jgi:hypothetical protein